MTSLAFPCEFEFVLGSQLLPEAVVEPEVLNGAVFVESTAQGGADISKSKLPATFELQLSIVI